MKTMKITAIVVALVLFLPVSVFAASDINSGIATAPRPIVTPAITNINTPPSTGAVPAAGTDVGSPVITPQGNAGQLNPNPALGNVLVSSMNMGVSADYKTNIVTVYVKDTQSYDPVNKLNNGGFVYPEMTITIQKMGEGELKYTDIGTAQYEILTYKPLGSTQTLTEGSASFSDPNVKAGMTYKYRIKHDYQSKTYYTAPQQIIIPTEDYQLLKLFKAKRVDLYFNCGWKIAAGDVYKYEVQRKGGPDLDYKTVAQVNIDNPYISDVIVNPYSSSYYYRIAATCLESNDPVKVGKSTYSQAIEIKMED